MTNTQMELREFVINGIAGNKFLSERDIAQRFNAKRANAREVLLNLEGHGIVRRIPQKGYAYIDYTSTDRQTVLTLRYSIEHEALRKALAGAMTREDLVRLTLIFEDMAAYATQGDSEHFIKCDLDFHMAIIESAHDEMLSKMFNFMRVTVFPLNKVMERCVEYVDQAQESHCAIFKAICAKDWEGARKALKQHIGKSVTL